MQKESQNFAKLMDLKKRLDLWEHNERLIENDIDVYELIEAVLGAPKHSVFLRILEEVNTTPEELRELLSAIDDCIIS